MDCKNLCFGCFADRCGQDICPHCGLDVEAEPESLLHLPPGTVLQDKYLIGKALGQGGFGITYLAWDIVLNIKLAIKEYLPQQLVTRLSGQSEIVILKSSLADEFSYGLNKFLDEARILARFNEHPNIVTVRDYFKAYNTAYLVMNYHEGITLKEYLDSKGGKISIEQALEIFINELHSEQLTFADDLQYPDLDNHHNNRYEDDYSQLPDEEFCLKHASSR